MLRIISGEYKGRKIFSPPSRSVRPTSGKVKEAVFQMLVETLPDAVVLDLYAGSGNLGIEAISRGASRVVFVDRSAASLALIRRNIEHLGLSDQSRIIRKDALRSLNLLSSENKLFNLVFVDPPYGSEEAKKMLRALDGCDILAPEALVVVEHAKHCVLPRDLSCLQMVKEKRHGDTMVSIFKNENPGARSQNKIKLLE